MSRILIIVLLLVPLSAAHAGDQVYVSRDADGNLVFTDSPTGEGWEVVGREPAAINPYLDYNEQESKYDKLILKYSRKNRLDPFLIKAIVRVESHFDPDAISEVGAHGLMQLMPPTGDRYGVTDLFDPAQNLAGGSRYMRDLLLMFGGDIKLAVAAYNCGEKTVLRYKRIPDIPETRNYVRKVLAARAEYRKSGFDAKTLSSDRVKAKTSPKEM